MSNCFLDQLLQVTDIVGIASCKKSKACNECKSYRIDRIVNIWLRQRFCLHAQLQCRRSLPLSQSINRIVEYNVDHIDISAPCTNQVTRADSKTIAVSANSNNFKLRICKFGSLCKWQHPAMQGMYADRKSTRLNSSHANISYAVFCLKKKKKS